MNAVFREYLFSHNILVSSCEQDEATRGYVLFSLMKLFAIKVTDGWELADEEMIHTCEEILGANVPEPFYRGFPESVRELTTAQLFFDQFIHYVAVNGLGFVDTPGHSIFEKIPKRALFAERVEYRNFRIITQAEAKVVLEGAVRDLLAGTRPLSDDQFTLVKTFISEFGLQDMHCASKSTAIRLLVDSRNLSLLRFLSLSDVIKVAEYINFYGYGGRHIDNINFKNRDRIFITAVIDGLVDTCTDFTHCFDKKKAWCGLLHHLHYKAKTPEARHFLDLMRGKENHSVYSSFEKALSKGNFREAVDVLLEGKGSSALLRSMNRLLCLAKDDEEIAYLLDKAVTKNPIALLQFIKKLSFAQKNDYRIFCYPRFGRMVTYFENTEKAAKHAALSDSIRSTARKKLLDNLRGIYHNRLGKVYIDPDMAKIALPINESTSQSGYGVMPKGSIVPLEGEGRVFRAFVYWEQVDDIDLSVIGVSHEGEQREFSWRSMYYNQCNAVTFSGDEVSGYNGGSEYFDIDVSEFKKLFPEMSYLVFNANVYSDEVFMNSVCRAGYMRRDAEGSGEIYEPKTVESAFTVNANARYVHLFALDLDNMRIVWLNMANEVNESVSGRRDQSYLYQTLRTTEIINWESFFTMLATERVYDPTLADVIVSDKLCDAIEGKELIRPCDYEKVIPLMQ